MTNATDAADAGEDAGFDLLDSLMLAPTHSMIGKAGSGARPLTFEYVRDLEPKDIALLAAGVNRTARALTLTARLTRLTHRHHLAAKLVAEGLSATEIAYATNYAATYVAELKGDPAFAELVAHYAEQKGQVYLDFHSRLAALGMSAIDKLQERLDALDDLGVDDSADDLEARRRAVMPTKVLQDIAQLALDRSLTPQGAKRNGGLSLDVSGPAAGQLLVQVQFGDPPASSSGPVIDVTPQESPA